MYVDFCRNFFPQNIETVYLDSHRNFFPQNIIICISKLKTNLRSRLASLMTSLTTMIAVRMSTLPKLESACVVASGGLIAREIFCEDKRSRRRRGLPPSPQPLARGVVTAGISLRHEIIHFRVSLSSSPRISHPWRDFIADERDRERVSRTFART